MAYFIWNSTDNRTKNIILNKFPDRNKASKRVEKITVPGRNGFLTQSDGTYEPVTLSVECTLKAGANIDDVVNWLDGTGMLTFSDDLNKEYEATIINAIPLTTVLKRYRSFIITFDCQPFLKGKTLNTVTITSPTLTASKTVAGNRSINPIMTLTGTGSFDITVNSKIIHLVNVETSIVLDSEMMNATESSGTVNANSKMSGDFPILKSGANTISIAVVSGSFTTLVTTYYDRYL